MATRASVKAYAEGMRRLMSDPELCSKMGEIARDYCAERYSKEKIIGKWGKLLEDVARRAVARKQQIFRITPLT